MPAGFVLLFRKAILRTYFKHEMVNITYFFNTWIKRSHDLVLQTDKNATKSVHILPSVKILWNICNFKNLAFLYRKMKKYMIL